MDLSEFVKAFSSQFEQTDPSTITPTTDFKELDEWDSLIALSIIAMVDENMEGKKVTADDIRDSKTIADLYKRVTK